MTSREEDVKTTEGDYNGFLSEISYIITNGDFRPRHIHSIRCSHQECSEDCIPRVAMEPTDDLFAAPIFKLQLGRCLTTETDEYLVISPDFPNKVGECLINIDALLSRRLDELAIEMLRKITSL